MNVFAKFFGGKAKQSLPEQAVIVYLDAQSLPDAVYEEHDLSTLEEQLEQALNATRAGSFDGNEFGPGVVTLYMYGPDAERLFSVVETPLRAYPLCAGAKVVVRRGGPGSPERMLVLGP